MDLFPGEIGRTREFHGCGLSNLSLRALLATASSCEIQKSPLV
ncbi:hypothetical protein SAMN05444955_106224 [Lihuaxuella thermophila]|uniref:Uncharacterized protein n=1 Tax=Lihuaxuella thermophila TaxID=1173111 RepID=A0A1H8EBL5_9BACL|nr:hypothetical protein SAMN05444955_106224 [Lihuaxuella thermophila]